MGDKSKPIRRDWIRPKGAALVKDWAHKRKLNFSPRKTTFFESYDQWVKIKGVWVWPPMGDGDEHAAIIVTKTPRRITLLDEVMALIMLSFDRRKEQIVVILIDEPEKSYARGPRKKA